MLAADTLHFWRVRAVNPCGNGSWSAARTFRTLVPVCSASALSIPDNSPAGASQQLGGAAARLEHLALRVEATHPRVGDLRLVLRHVPSNTSAQVAARHLGCSLADIAADFDSRDGQIAQCFAGAPAALSGRLRPEQSFSVFAGLDAAGPWELRVADELSGSSGQITRWCVDLAVDGDALFRNGFEP
jgi:subtilisin-like proprotein convertase family protein